MNFGGQVDMDGYMGYAPRDPTETCVPFTSWVQGSGLKIED
jgi:hypothetical protein